MKSDLWRVWGKLSAEPNHCMFIYCFVFGYRLLLCLCNRTFAQPDEFFQSLEIAHVVVFGYGVRTWEWQPASAVRSPLYPLLFAGVYALIDGLGLADTPWLIVAPKILQAAILTAVDLGTAALASRAFGPAPARTALILSLVSPLHIYYGTRTFSNAFEAALLVAFLNVWHPLSRRFSYGRLVACLALAGLTVTVRPPASLFFLPLFLRLLRRSPQRIGIAFAAAATASLILLATTLVDSLFYGKLTCTPLAFLYQNVLNSVASFYGENTIFFYLFATPLVAGLFLPWALTSVWSSTDPLVADLLWASAGNILGLSLLPHKELRFVLPLVPVAHIIMSNSTLPRAKLLLFLCLLSTVPPTVVNVAHCPGQVAVMPYLASLPNTTAVLFLMPCHSTPMQSFFHKNITLRAITCEPNLTGDPNYLDESDKFYDDPVAFTSALLENESYSHIVIFEALRKEIEKILQVSHYTPVKSIYNSIWHDDERRRGDIIVYQYQP